MAEVSHPQRVREALFHARGALVLWAAAAGLAVLFVPLFALYDSLQAEITRQQMAVMEAQMARVAPVSEQELASLRAAAAEAAAVEEYVQSTLARMSQGGVPWLAVLQRVMPQPGSGVRLTELSQEQDRLLIRGVAKDEAALAAYAAHLRGSPLFDGIQVEVPSEQYTISLRIRGYQ
ncbi:MAG: PilN domain-containing protein [Anaerolineae bacterium]|nr:PilN domain-containing protein [Anaerolineae bacterium]